MPHSTPVTSFLTLRGHRSLPFLIWLRHILSLSLRFELYFEVYITRNFLPGLFFTGSASIFYFRYDQVLVFIKRGRQLL